MFAHLLCFLCFLDGHLRMATLQVLDGGGKSSRGAPTFEVGSQSSWPLHTCTGWVIIIINIISTCFFR